MVNVNRFIKIQAVNINNNKYRPIWEGTFVKDSYYGSHIIFKDDTNIYCNIVECYYDLLKKNIFLGHVKDIYPNNNLKYQIGETIFIEIKHHELKKDTIIDIIYEKYNSTIIIFKHLENFYKKYFTKEELDSFKFDDLIEIRDWIPFFKMKSGTIIEWEHMIYKLANDDDHKPVIPDINIESLTEHINENNHKNIIKSLCDKK